LTLASIAADSGVRRWMILAPPSFDIGRFPGLPPGAGAGFRLI